MPRSSATAIVERQQRRRGGVDRHRHRHLAQRDAVEQDVHVLDRRDRDARAPDLAARQRVIGIAAHLGRQVERDRQPRLPGGEQELVAPVGLLGGAEAGVLPHRPRLAAVHGGVDAARERERARAVPGRAPGRTGACAPPGCPRRRPAPAGCRTTFRRGRARSLTPSRSRGRRRARSAWAPSCAWISSTDTPGARSRSDEPGRRHVDDGEVGDDAVHARRRRSAAACSAGRIFVSPPLATCSIITITRLAAGDEVHRAAHALDHLAGDHPVGEVAVLARPASRRGSRSRCGRRGSSRTTPPTRSRRCPAPR